MEQLQENVPKTTQKVSFSMVDRSSTQSHRTADFTVVQQQNDLFQIHFTSHRKVFGGIVLIIKRAISRLLTPILERQSSYNEAASNLIVNLYDQLEVVEKQTVEREKFLQENFEQKINELEWNLKSYLNGQLTNTENKLREEFIRKLHESQQSFQASSTLQLKNPEDRLSMRFVEQTQEEIDTKELQKNWQEFGRTDPLWAIIGWPDKKGNRWDINEFFHMGIDDINVIMSQIKSMGISLRYGKALDFGCGVGRLTQALVKYFDEVVGVDIAPAMIELARSYNRYHERCRYYLNDANNLSVFSENTFDFIFSLITLQHIKPTYSKTYIKEFLRILVPSGLLVFQLPGVLLPENEPLKEPAKQASGAEPYEAAMNQPYMEMHGIPTDELINFIIENGGKVLGVREDQSAGPEWSSFRYFVTK